MKKHIFGFVLFSLIVALFALIYAFFFAPSIPPKESVKPPTPQPDVRTDRPACYPKRLKDLSYEVISANYFAEQGKLVSKVKLNWNGRGVAPKIFSVTPRIFTADNFENSIALKVETLVDPFVDGNSKTISVESKYIPTIDSSPANLYIGFEFLDDAGRTYAPGEKVNPAEIFHILYVYGENPPEIRKEKTILRGRAITK